MATLPGPEVTGPALVDVDGLDAIDVQILALVPEGLTDSQIGARLDPPLHRTSVWRRRQSAAFVAALSRVHAEGREAVEARIRRRAVRTIENLEQLADGADVPAATRLRANEILATAAGLLTPTTTDAATREREALAAAAGGPEKLAALIDSRVASALGIGKGPRS